jgi:hypothetical protein
VEGFHVWEFDGESMIRHHSPCTSSALEIVGADPSGKKYNIEWTIKMVASQWQKHWPTTLDGMASGKKMLKAHVVVSVWKRFEHPPGTTGPSGCASFLKPCRQFA